MDPARFRAPEVGRVIKTPGRFGFYAFVPASLPRSIDLDAQTVMVLSEADSALGRLAGAGRLLPEPHLLVGPYLAREALASSRIEGTQASLSEVFQAAAAPEAGASDDAREVVNYIHAMNHGLRRLSSLPLSLRLIREIHGVLMAGVRGRSKQPGEFRTSPNWIGSPDDRPDTAIFVPPLHEEMLDCLSDLESFLHEDPVMPVLVRSALVHYQFETIHPFLDGNGRLGRLLIVFHLIHRRRLPEPLLYLSSYFEQRREEYYDRLQAVRERGEVLEWLRFFLNGVQEQARDAIGRAERLSDLRESYRRELAGSTRSRAPEVVDLLLKNPVISTSDVSRELGMSSQGAMNLIRQIEERGWLSELGRFGRGGRTYWVASQILEVIEDVTPQFASMMDESQRDSRGS